MNTNRISVVFLFGLVSLVTKVACAASNFPLGLDIEPKLILDIYKAQGDSSVEGYQMGYLKLSKENVFNANLSSDLPSDQINFDDIEVFYDLDNEYQTEFSFIYHSDIAESNDSITPAYYDFIWADDINNDSALDPLTWRSRQINLLTSLGAVNGAFILGKATADTEGGIFYKWGVVLETHLQNIDIRLGMSQFDETLVFNASTPSGSKINYFSAMFNANLDSTHISAGFDQTRGLSGRYASSKSNRYHMSINQSIQDVDIVADFSRYHENIAQGSSSNSRNTTIKSYGVEISSPIYDQITGSMRYRHNEYRSGGGDVTKVVNITIPVDDLVSFRLGHHRQKFTDGSDEIYSGVSIVYGTTMHL